MDDLKPVASKAQKDSSLVNRDVTEIFGQSIRQDYEQYTHDNSDCENANGNTKSSVESIMDKFSYGGAGSIDSEDVALLDKDERDELCAMLSDSQAKQSWWWCSLVWLTLFCSLHDTSEPLSALEDEDYVGWALVRDGFNLCFLV